MNKGVDNGAFYKLGYGLYALTVNDGSKDNGMISNTVMQVSGEPLRVAISVNKANYSHGVIKSTGLVNVNCLTEEAGFYIFEWLGFSSGRDVNKFEGTSLPRTENGLIYLQDCVNAVLSLKVEEYTDLGSHGLFICSVTEAKVLDAAAPSMTYAYYHAHVKPKPAAKRSEKVESGGERSENKRYVCKICGHIYEGEELPADYVCPICKHGSEDFEQLD